MRPLRHFVPGLPVHLVHRGHNRQRIFHCTADSLLFRQCLGEAAAKFQVAVHAYVLMSNHVHLLLTPAKGEWDVSRAMQSAGRCYVGYFNRRYRRTGTLWESRFHASVIESDRYLLACHRYIDLNPVRAGIVERPECYRWSSHRRYAGGGSEPLITPHALINALGADDAGRERAYRQLFDTLLSGEELDGIRKATRSGSPLGRPPRFRRRGRPRKNDSDTNFAQFDSDTNFAEIDSDTNFPVIRPDTGPREVATR